MNTHSMPFAGEIQGKSHLFKVRAAFALAFFSAVMGLVFCLTKSPQAKSEAYMAAAIHAYEAKDSAAAFYAAFEAARQNPSMPQSWSLMSRVLAGNGEWQKAESARAIASLLQNKAVSTLAFQPVQSPSALPLSYATTPATLRLSLLVPVSATEMP